MEPKHVRNRLRIAFILLPVALLLGKLFPFVIRRLINKNLNAIPHGQGQVKHVTFSLFSTVLTIRDAIFKITDETINQTDLTVTIDSATIKLHWLPLWKGEIVADVTVQAPCVSLVKTYHELVFKYLQRSFIMDAPINISSLKITGGILQFTNMKTTPPVKARVEELNIEGYQLTNINQVTETLPAKIFMTGNAFGGKLKADIRAGFMEYMPAFDLNMEINGIQLVQLNDFFTAYGKFDVSKGNLNLYTEIAARDGKFKGYAKPLITNLQILSRQDMQKGFLNFIWETIVAAGSGLIENRSKDQIASKIPFEGTFKSPRVNTWYAISETLINAFVQALRPSFDLDIDIRSVRRAF